MTAVRLVVKGVKSFHPNERGKPYAHLGLTPQEVAQLAKVGKDLSQQLGLPWD